MTLASLKEKCCSSWINTRLPKAVLFCLPKSTTKFQETFQALCWSLDAKSWHVSFKLVVHPRPNVSSGVIHLQWETCRSAGKQSLPAEQQTDVATSSAISCLSFHCYFLSATSPGCKFTAGKYFSLILGSTEKHVSMDEWTDHFGIQMDQTLWELGSAPDSSPYWISDT